MPFIVRELQSRISVDPLVNGKKQEMQALASFRSPPDKCLLVPKAKQWTDLALAINSHVLRQTTSRFFGPASKECF